MIRRILYLQTIGVIVVVVVVPFLSFDYNSKRKNTSSVLSFQISSRTNHYMKRINDNCGVNTSSSALSSSYGQSCIHSINHSKRAKRSNVGFTRAAACNSLSSNVSGTCLFQHDSTMNNSNDDENKNINNDLDDDYRNQQYMDQLQRRKKRRQKETQQQQRQRQQQHYRKQNSSKSTKMDVEFFYDPLMPRKSDSRSINDNPDSYNNNPRSKSGRNSNDDNNNKNNKNNKKTQMRSGRRAMRRRKLRESRNNQVNSLHVEDFLIPNTINISKMAMDSARDVAAKSKRFMSEVGNELNDFIYDDDDFRNVDENGVKEVDWSYVSKDDERDIEEGRVRKKQRKQRNRNRRTSSSKSSLYDRSTPRQEYSYRTSTSYSDVINSRKRPRQPSSSPETRKEYINNMKQTMVKETTSSSDSSSPTKSENKTAFLLPPSDAKEFDLNKSNDLMKETDIDRDSMREIPIDQELMKKKNKTTTNRRKRRRNPNDGSKRVYSVYPQQESDNESFDDFQDLYGKVASDAIDSVGNLMVDVIEGKYWNSTQSSNEKSINNETSTSFPNNNNNTNQGHENESKHKSQQSQRRHWRDRLNEKVDYALGVHEDGEYYKRWGEKLDRDKSFEDVGTDPLSIFNGRQKRDDNIKREVNFWEEDGSLKSLIFGRIPNGKKLKKLSIDVSFIYLEDNSYSVRRLHFLNTKVSHIIAFDLFTYCIT